MNFASPKIEVGSIVTTFRQDLRGITIKRRYIVEKCDKEFVYLRNDEGQISPYKTIYFFESDVVFSILLYLTINRLLNFE